MLNDCFPSSSEVGVCPRMAAIARLGLFGCQAQLAWVEAAEGPSWPMLAAQTKPVGARARFQGDGEPWGLRRPQDRVAVQAGAPKSLEQEDVWA